MGYYQNFKLILTVFVIWLSLFLPIEIEEISAVIAVVTLGIFHGSFDVYLLQKQYQKKSYNTIQFTVLYISLAGMMTFLVNLMPLIGFLFFLVFSSYHFGEQQLIAHSHSIKAVRSLYYTSYGILLFSILASSHQETVDELLLLFIETTVDERIWSFLQWCCGLLFVLLIGVNQSMTIGQKIRELLYMAFFIIIFKSTSLYFSFAFYFIIWHAIPSIMDQIKIHYHSLNRSNTLSYSKAAFPYWLVALIGLFGLISVASRDNLINNQLIFSLGIAITSVHIVLIALLYSKNKKTVLKN